MNQTVRVLAGLIAGLVIGILLAWRTPETALQTAAIVEPFGKLWLNALQMTVVPLVFSLVVVGINQASDAAHSGRVAKQAIMTFVLLLTAAAAMTAVLAPLALSLLQPSHAVAVALQAHGEASPAASGGWAAALTAIVPSNALAAAVANAMLPLVTFALFFGFALTRIEATGRTQVVGFFKAVSDAMIVIVHWVLLAAPVGIFALVLALTARAGLDVLQALGIYILLECALYALATILLIATALTFGRRKLGEFMTALVPVQAVAASTQSSLATLPAMLDSAQNRLAIPARISGLVLPMAVSLFRITSPIQYIATACFIAWALGAALTPAQLATGVALSVLVSMGSVGLPGQAIFLATNLPVTSALGLPISPLPVLMAVDAIPDVLATVGNVTGDMTATAVVAARNPAQE
ncbi:dicarboxylate/amino acid:cation symporter [Thermomonas sp.]|uniref:dicarboxylate/amino acid:cation symporter n=1 Tax=Thermomonas sp. TaxID=1971895 RepID=UPI001DC2BFF6|nr:dicarboxylate/amino acid:cation symporter [Thermomonas sp.]MBZ0087479.1 dicarboxylate/amino acid:cation symporter [Thermomonas sp.]HRO63681.1 dicarboxylate/amino acid:cation symporter [Thermomonas sp.]